MSALILYNSDSMVFASMALRWNVGGWKIFVWILIREVCFGKDVISIGARAGLIYNKGPLQPEPPRLFSKLYLEPIEVILRTFPIFSPTQSSINRINYICVNVYDTIRLMDAICVHKKNMSPKGQSGLHGWKQKWALWNFWNSIGFTGD